MKYAKTRFCENTDEVVFPGVGPYNIPKLDPVYDVPEAKWIGYSQAKRADPKGKAVHFFEDDYRFERLWRNWKFYGEKLAKFDAVMTPDFSMYTDWPRAICIYNHYRRHFIGAYLQALGVTVIPTISWIDKASFDWCFDGDPVGGIVAVSSVGTQASKKTKALFLDGWHEMLSRLHPCKVLFYGRVPEECTGNIVRIKPFTDKFMEVLPDGR